ncbi:hypothetical protein QE364_001900 [Nocardioides zeae]|uniref:Uncharacterized protein n=1 Tax=Nocardioides zeae TaxID=1457234 RepID=A0ACC6IHU8_9ACTN|nr:hypothetical protein [Nocardioides zeae]MDR6173200.1 hypothetical protein [Nocardioides zeae]MDR6210193.1 hypothetical protein [Nocardioides zeae]
MDGRRSRTLVAIGAVTGAVLLVGGVVGMVDGAGSGPPRPGGDDTGGAVAAPTTTTWEVGTATPVDAAAFVARQDVMTFGSATTAAGDVATVWGEQGGPRYPDAPAPVWALALRPADGPEVTLLLPGSDRPPALLPYDDGFLLADQDSGALTAVDVDGGTTQPAETGAFGVAAGDVAVVTPRRDAVRVFSPERDAVQTLPRPDVDALGSAAVTGDGTVVATWSRFEGAPATDRGAEAGVATWDGRRWDVVELDRTPPSGSGLGASTTSGTVAAAGRHVVATTAESVEATAVRTIWTSDDGGATWEQQDRTPFPATLVDVATTAAGTVVGTGVPADLAQDGIVRLPAGGPASGVVGPELMSSTDGDRVLWWAGDALWGRGVDGDGLWRSADDGRAWTAVPPAGR